MICKNRFEECTGCNDPCQRSKKGLTLVIKNPFVFRKRVKLQDLRQRDIWVVSSKGEAL